MLPFLFLWGKRSVSISRERKDKKMLHRLTLYMVNLYLEEIWFPPTGMDYFGFPYDLHDFINNTSARYGLYNSTICSSITTFPHPNLKSVLEVLLLQLKPLNSKCPSYHFGGSGSKGIEAWLTSLTFGASGSSCNIFNFSFRVLISSSLFILSSRITARFLYLIRVRLSQGRLWRSV